MCGAGKLSAQYNTYTSTNAVGDNVFYVENGQVKLGIALNLGGNPVHLSKNSIGTNTINRHDLGHEFGIDSYSGPENNFHPNGLSSDYPDKNRFNPQLCGDIHNNPSTLLSYNFDASTGTLTTVTSPKHWGFNNVTAQATIEMKYVFQPNSNAIKVTLKVSYNRTDDSNTYGGQGCGIAYLYANKNFTRIVTYNGLNPFATNPDPNLTTIDYSPAGSQGGTISETEHWYALIDPNTSSGFGLYQTFTRSNFGIIQYDFFNMGDAGGELGNASPFIQPSQTLTVGPNTVIERECYIILGTINEIRQFAYSKEQNWVVV